VRVLKDVDLVDRAAGDVGLPLLAALSCHWRAAVDADHGREDVSAARPALGGHLQPEFPGPPPTRCSGIDGRSCHTR
jgi:hypothetical protein